MLTISLSGILPGEYFFVNSENVSIVIIALRISFPLMISGLTFPFTLQRI